MKENKKNAKLDEVISQDEHLKLILNSLHFASQKFNKQKSLIVEKDYLVFKIIDFCKVRQDKAVFYLKILESRGLLRIDRETIEFYPEKYEEELFKGRSK